VYICTCIEGTCLEWRSLRPARSCLSPSKSQQACCTLTQPVMHKCMNQCHGIMLVPMVHCHPVSEPMWELITISRSQGWHLSLSCLFFCSIISSRLARCPSWSKVCLGVTKAVRRHRLSVLSIVGWLDGSSLVIIKFIRSFQIQGQVVS